MTQKFNVKITKQRVIAAKFVGASSQTIALSNNVDQKHDVVVAAQLDVEARQNDVIARQDDVTTKQTDVTNKQTDVTTKRDEAVAAQLASETARDASIAAQGASETARDQSITAQGLSEDARDASVLAQGASETARDQSVAAQVAAEAARDEAQSFAPGKATQPQAEGGTNDATYMTPLKTAQAIAALGGVDQSADFTWAGTHRFTKTIEIDPTVSGMRVLINNNSDILNIGFDDDENGNLDNPIAFRLIGAGGLNYAQVFGNTVWDEGTLPKASQAEAEAGTASDRLMTPERTKQAIDARQNSATYYSRTYTPAEQQFAFEVINNAEVNLVNGYTQIKFLSGSTTGDVSTRVLYEMKEFVPWANDNIRFKTHVRATLGSQNSEYRISIGNSDVYLTVKCTSKSLSSTYRVYLHYGGSNSELGVLGGTANHTKRGLVEWEQDSVNNEVIGYLNGVETVRVPFTAPAQGVITNIPTDDIRVEVVTKVSGDEDYISLGDIKVTREFIS